MSSFLAILMAVIQLILPLLPAGEFQAKGSLSANGIPAAYQTVINTKSQTVEIDIRAILSTIFQLKADVNGIMVDGEYGSTSYSADDFLHEFDRLLEHRTGRSLTWESLSHYISSGSYSEDLSAIFRWLATAKLALPYPEIVEENGVTYNRVTLNPSQILAIVNSAIDSLTTPSKAAQELEGMKIWNVLGVEATPNIRYLRYLIDKMIGDPWRNSTYNWLFETNLHLDVQWAAEPSPNHTALLPVNLPGDLHFKAAFFDNGTPIEWDVDMSKSEISGSVHFGNLQTLEFSLMGDKNYVTLYADYCVYDQEHYILTAEYSVNLMEPSWKAKLDKHYQVSSDTSYITPLLTVAGNPNEIVFFARDEYSTYRVQGSLYWLSDQYNLFLRICDLSSGSAETYEIHAEADAAAQNGSILSVIWNCDVFRDNLDQKAQFSGLLDCMFSESKSK